MIGGQPQTITVTAQQLAALQQQQQIKVGCKPKIAMELHVLGFITIILRMAKTPLGFGHN